MRYDPNKYEDVATRLQRIHAVNPNLRVITEIAWHDEEFNKVCFKASLMEGDSVLATGYAMDWKSKDRGATTTNWVETSETSAIGRCIANSKYQDKNAERPSKQEMEIAAERKAENKAVTPTSNGKPAPAAPVQSKPDVGKYTVALEKVVGKNAKAVNTFLIGRNQIKQGETYKDVSEHYAKSIVEYPSKFLALVLSSEG